MATRERRVDDTDEGPMISVNCLARPGATDEFKKQLLELQLKMATSSINHEYARLEYDDVEDPEQREELLDYMNECRCKYLDARSELLGYDPHALQEFEEDLLLQKQKTILHYNA